MLIATSHDSRRKKSLTFHGVTFCLELSTTPSTFSLLFFDWIEMEFQKFYANQRRLNCKIDSVKKWIIKQWFHWRFHDCRQLAWNLRFRVASLHYAPLNTDLFAYPPFEARKSDKKVLFEILRIDDLIVISLVWKWQRMSFKLFFWVVARKIICCDKNY